MKTEKISLGLVLATFVGLVLGLWFTFSKYRIWKSVKNNRDGGADREGAKQRRDRVINFKRQVDRIVADLPEKAHGNRSRNRP